MRESIGKVYKKIPFNDFFYSMKLENEDDLLLGHFTIHRNCSHYRLKYSLRKGCECVCYEIFLSLQI